MPRSSTFSDDKSESLIRKMSRNSKPRCVVTLRLTFRPIRRFIQFWRSCLLFPLAKADAELIKGLKGEEFRSRFFAIVEQGLLSLAEQQPVVLVIDDLHWADASSIDLLAYILPLIKRTRLTFIGR